MHVRSLGPTYLATTTPSFPGPLQSLAAKSVRAKVVEKEEDMAEEPNKLVDNFEFSVHGTVRTLAQRNRESESGKDRDACAVVFVCVCIGACGE